MPKPSLSQLNAENTFTTIEVGEATIRVGSDGGVQVDHWNVTPKAWGRHSGIDQAVETLLRAVDHEGLGLQHPALEIVPALMPLLRPGWSADTRAPDLLPVQLLEPLRARTADAAALALFREKGHAQNVRLALRDALTDPVCPRTAQIAFAVLLAPRASTHQLTGLLRLVTDELPKAVGWGPDTFNDLAGLLGEGGLAPTRALRVSVEALKDKHQMMHLCHVAEEHALIAADRTAPPLTLSRVKDLVDLGRRIQLAMGQLQMHDAFVGLPTWARELDGQQSRLGVVEVARTAGQLKTWGAIRRDCLGDPSHIAYAHAGDVLFIGLHPETSGPALAPQIVAEFFVGYNSSRPELLDCYAPGNEPPPEEARRLLMDLVRDAFRAWSPPEPERSPDVPF